MSIELKDCKKQVAIHDKHIHTLNKAVYNLYNKYDTISDRIDSDDITTDIPTSLYTVYRTFIYVVCSLLKVGLLAFLFIGYLYSIKESLSYGYLAYMDGKTVVQLGMNCQSANIYIPSVAYNYCCFPVLKCTNYTHEIYVNPQLNTPFHNYSQMIEYGRPYLKPYKCDTSYYTTEIETTNTFLYTTVNTVFNNAQFMYNISFDCAFPNVKHVGHFITHPEFYDGMISHMKEAMLRKCN